MDNAIRGHKAIDLAARIGARLDKYADPIEEAREGISIEEAREIAAIDPSLVYTRPGLRDELDADGCEA